MDFLGINKVETKTYSAVQSRLCEMRLTRRKRERDEILHQGEEKEQRRCKSGDCKIILPMKAKEAGTEPRGKKEVVSLC